jgi:hypothetical protein
VLWKLTDSGLLSILLDVVAYILRMSREKLMWLFFFSFIFSFFLTSLHFSTYDNEIEYSSFERTEKDYSHTLHYFHNQAIGHNAIAVH